MRRFVFSWMMLSLAMMAPRWASADDHEIAQQIFKRLKQHQDAGDFRGFSINLQVEQGVVWMKGHVGSEAQEHLALDVARRVPGVVKVIDIIDVKTDSTPAKTPPATPAIAKSQIIPRTQTAEAVEAVDEKPIAAKVNHVEPETEVVRAAPERNETFRPAAPARPLQLTDEQIAEAIIGKLTQQKNSGKLRGFGVDVSVDKGDVWLKGRVASQDQLQLVLDTARNVRGVKQVVNDLSIVAPRQPKPASHPVVNAVAENVQDVPHSPVTAASGPTPSPPVAGKLIPVRAIPVHAMPAHMHGAPMHGGQMHGGQMHGGQMPHAYAPATVVNHSAPHGGPVPMHAASPAGYGVAPARFDHPNMPGYAWPSYAASPNYAAVTYPKQYSAQAWPYIGPFYPYPQVPLGWRKVELQWSDGWWFLDYKSK